MLLNRSMCVCSLHGDVSSKALSRRLIDYILAMLLRLLGYKVESSLTADQLVSSDQRPIKCVVLLMLVSLMLNLYIFKIVVLLQLFLLQYPRGYGYSCIFNQGVK